MTKRKLGKPRNRFLGSNEIKCHGWPVHHAGEGLGRIDRVVWSVAELSVDGMAGYATNQKASQRRRIGN